MRTSTKTSRRLRVLTTRRLGVFYGQRALGAIAAAACLLALGGCGSSENGVAGKSGKEILAASKAAAEGARSVHVVARASQGPASLTSDLALGRDSAHASRALGRLAYELTRIGGTLYVKGPASFLEFVTQAPVKIPPGAWLKGPANGKLAQLAALTDLPRELDLMLSTPGSVTKGARTTIKGQKAIELKEKTKVYEGVLYVATTGKPYPLLLVKSGGRERGKTSFSGWDQPVSLVAPSPSVDVSTLKG